MNFVPGGPSQLSPLAFSKHSIFLIGRASLKKNDLYETPKSVEWMLLANDDTYDSYPLAMTKITSPPSWSFINPAWMAALQIDDSSAKTMVPKTDPLSWCKHPSGHFTLNVCPDGP